jgi:hypothetical protein
MDPPHRSSGTGVVTLVGEAVAVKREAPSLRPDKGTRQIGVILYAKGGPFFAGRHRRTSFR